MMFNRNILAVKEAQLNQTKKMNPQKQLNLLKQMCMRNIENQNKAAQSTENPTTETTTNN